MRAQRAGPGVRFGLRAELGSVPFAVWALAGLQLAVLLCYSALVPVYRAPDEPQNFDIALAATDVQGFTGHHDKMSARVLRSYPFASFAMDARRRPVPPVPPAARGARPSFADLAAPAGTSQTRNQQWQHPPLHPVVLGTALTVVTNLYPPAYDWAFDQTVGFARAVNALLVAPLPLFAFLTARRLRADRTAALAAATFPLTIPQLAHIGSAVSHDNLLVLLVGLITVAVAFVLRGDASLRTAAALGTLGGLALLTKGFALFLLAWLAGVYALAVVRWRRRAFLSAGALTAVLTSVVGAWWWLRNVDVHGTVQPTGVGLPTPDADFVPDFGWWSSWFADVVPARFWGHMGWYQASLPAWVPDAATGLVLAAVLLALIRRRAGGPARLDLLAMAFPTLAIGGIVAYGGWAYYTETSFALGLQGRYLFPGLAGLAVLVGAGLAALPARVARWAPPGLLVAAAGMHGMGVHAILRDMYGAGTAFPWGVAGAVVAAWSPWPGWLQATTLGALAALAVTAMTFLVRDARRLRPPPPARAGRHAARRRPLGDGQTLEAKPAHDGQTADRRATPTGASP